MFWILVSMVAILAVAAVVAAYVAFTRRGEAVPRLPWLGDALQRTVDTLPTLGNLHPNHGQAEGRSR